MNNNLSEVIVICVRRHCIIQIILPIPSFEKICDVIWSWRSLLTSTVNLQIRYLSLRKFFHDEQVCVKNSCVSMFHFYVITADGLAIIRCLLISTSKHSELYSCFAYTFFIITNWLITNL